MNDYRKTLLYRYLNLRGKEFLLHIRVRIGIMIIKSYLTHCHAFLI